MSARGKLIFHAGVYPNGTPLKMTAEDDGVKPSILPSETSKAHSDTVF